MDYVLWGVVYALIPIVGWIIKRSLEKSIDGSIEAAFSKDVAKYQDSLARASAARQFILEREMAFFDSADDQLADLVPLIQDMCDSVINQTFSDYDKECYLKYFESIFSLKRLSLRFEPYIPREIYLSFVGFVVQMQEDSTLWHDYAAILSSGEKLSKEDYEKANQSCEKLLHDIAQVRLRQMEYLEKISHRKPKNFRN